MPPLPTPLALTVRLLPVAVLAVAGIAMTSAPSDSGSDHHDSQASADEQHQGGDASPDPSGDATAAASKSFETAPAPCGSISGKTIGSLVPGAKTAGKELKSTDEKLRRTCSWNALKGFDYRWLDVSFEIRGSEAEASKGYQERAAQMSAGGKVPGLGDEAFSYVNLTTKDKQQQREGTVMVRVSNALVTVTYIGSDYENKKAPGTDEINKGAIKAAKEAVGALGEGKAA